MTSFMYEEIPKNGATAKKIDKIWIDFTLENPKKTNQRKIVLFRTVCTVQGAEAIFQHFSFIRP